MTNKKVLDDHKLIKKKFIPPFINKIGPLQEYSWVKTIIPELLWIALIQDYYGYINGVFLIKSLARLARKYSSSKKDIFATISSMTSLTKDEQSSLKVELATSGDLFKIQKALLPLVKFYNECPLKFLYTEMPNLSREEEKHLNSIKVAVERLYDKTSRYSMMVQATAIGLAFDAEALKFHKDSALSSFPEIEKYPKTELSKRVAANIRASIFFLIIEPFYPVSSEWPRYFWNRGLYIDPCYFEEPSYE